MSFGGIDLGILVVYMLGITVWGAWLGRGQTGGSDYFLGSRNLPWWAVMLSVVATETSTLTFLSVPGIAYLGTLAFLQLSIGYLVGRIVVAKLLLPAYYRGELTTAYALLGQQFGDGVQRFTSAVFMVTRLLADSVRLFATAIPLALITGWSYELSIGVIGVLTLIYTFYGGIKAVVWVDALQMVLYVGGGIAALVLLNGLVDGGWGTILSAAGAEGKLQVFDFSTDPSVAYTFWAGLVGGGFLSMASHGADQLIVQRLLTCRDLAHSQRAIVWSGVAVMGQFALFLLVGLGLWVFFDGRTFETTDRIFAEFIIGSMPVGLKGVLIAGVFAAAMSSLSSSINALASAAAYDFWGPVTGNSDNDPALLKAGKVFTVVWAIVLILGAMAFIPLSEGTAAVEVALAVASMVYGGLLGAFALAVFAPGTGSKAVIVGMIGGIGSVVALWVGARTAVAWPWFVLIGLVITFVVGLAASRVLPGNDATTS